MRHQVSKDLFAYWRELKGARSAPDRSDIDPGKIRHILADTFIIEVDADRAFPLRLSGTRVNALWLREQKGGSFLDLWSADDRQSVSAALTTVIDGVAPVVAGVKTRAENDARLELELLLLPLRYFGKTHARVLGALSPVYQPDWLGYLSAGPLELISMRVIGAPSVRSGVSFRRSEPMENARPRPRLVVYDGVNRDVDIRF
ncbi:PAS domain-containing protein [Methylocystis sp. Sn-Cys]|uniref:PAS domain-containing protein n=1 Tax=Methylocystis sp. Sn-Cys TaxID=1701263 RepID=UPI0019248AC2|nr:PAS domain-containing protein [Methylocystis sp. Sn-Cys]MBL1256454.1 PAS domain-containing protein [Methylocystis sp. Sn-Cys]